MSGPPLPKGSIVPSAYSPFGQFVPEVTLRVEPTEAERDAQRERNLISQADLEAVLGVETVRYLADRKLLGASLLRKRKGRFLEAGWWQHRVETCFQRDEVERQLTALRAIVDQLPPVGSLLPK
jgi:hypothetical protein